ncbi:MAG: hypothetical protein NC485_12350 [Ruminococcus flavefaciens]|nr:hypothetical protein [Ruminococcus flavefaciens]MCM1060110.1 hypothetical protein [Eubacterium sp.]
MIKFHEIGMYKNAVNIPYCKVPDTIADGVKNGYAVTYSETTKTVSLPTATTAKDSNLTIVMNVLDKPELKSPDDYVVNVGEYARLFRLDSLANRMLDMNDLALTTAYENVAVGDRLIAGIDGKWSKSASVDGYSAYLEVIEKTSFCGNGLLVKVNA